jgi:hypothetical protein
MSVTFFHHQKPNGESLMNSLATWRFGFGDQHGEWKRMEKIDKT